MKKVRFTWHTQTSSTLSCNHVWYAYLHREIQAVFKKRVAAKFKLSVVWGKLAPDLITVVHMAVDIFLENSDVIYVLIGSERIKNMSETDSVAKRVWHWWFMLSWHYSGHCLYPHEEKHNKKMKTWAFRKCWRKVWCLRDVVLEGVECVVFVRLVQRGSSMSGTAHGLICHCIIFPHHFNFKVLH